MKLNLKHLNWWRPFCPPVGITVHLLVSKNVGIVVASQQLYPERKFDLR
jgi:hypothetical protein